MLEEKLLIWKLKRGDREALRVLYDKYKGRLRAIAGAMLGDYETAEDVLHDVFVKFAENAGQIRIDKSLKNYLTASVVNRVRDEFRRRKPVVLEADSNERCGAESGRPDRRVEDNEKMRLLTEALSQVPYEQREVIVMHLKGGMKFKEIAKMQRASIGTIYGRYRYGLEKLRTILNGSI